MKRSRDKTDDSTKEDESLRPVISKYTSKDTVEDGVFVKVSSIGKYPIYFTRNLFESEYYHDEKKRADLLNKGVELIRDRYPEDSDYMRLRVVEKDEVWMVLTGEGITFMKPEDY